MTTIDPLERLRERSIAKLDDAAALDHIADLVDASADAGFSRGADRALFLLEELERRDLSQVQRATAEYFRANAWAIKEAASGLGSWDWEHPEREQQILALSRAAQHPGFIELSIVRRCQILTNRANQLNTMGRCIDAIESWDQALRIIPEFAMARGNRAYGVKHYGGSLDNDADRAVFLLHAYDGFVSACADDAVFESDHADAVARRFADEAKVCAQYMDVGRIRALEEQISQPLGRSRAERTYRQWCLEKRLFLNPLNDLGPHTSAACDDLMLPSLSEGFDERPGDFRPPPIMGFFNQMKQEYVSARFMLFEGLSDTKTHFSDREVRLVDTLDYPLHSLATERIRAAYRIAYSLLDKVAFLIDHYWKLGKHPERINFKNVWMIEGKARLLDRFKVYPNWPLRGLFWLSKELFDDQLKQSTAPDARELHDIRNALEHKFLKVHEGWAAPFRGEPPGSTGLGLSIDSDLLEAKALRVMKIARAALIQVVMAVGVEERKAARERPDTIMGAMPMYDLEDRRKRRDPG